MGWGDRAAEQHEKDQLSTPVCGEFVSWWAGEYEGNCELLTGHDGDHYDGRSWFNDDGDCTDWQHE